MASVIILERNYFSFFFACVLSKTCILITFGKLDIILLHREASFVDFFSKT